MSCLNFPSDSGYMRYLSDTAASGPILGQKEKKCAKNEKYKNRNNECTIFFHNCPQYSTNLNKIH